MQAACDHEKGDSAAKKQLQVFRKYCQLKTSTVKGKSTPRLRQLEGEGRSGWGQQTGKLLATD